MKNQVYCQCCKECLFENCEHYFPNWHLGKGICFYEPDDYEGDIGSATVKEMREQNEYHR